LSNKRRPKKDCISRGRTAPRSEKIRLFPPGGSIGPLRHKAARASLAVHALLPIPCRVSPWAQTGQATGCGKGWGERGHLPKPPILCKERVGFFLFVLSDDLRCKIKRSAHGDTACAALLVASGAGGASKRVSDLSALACRPGRQRLPGVCLVVPSWESSQLCFVVSDARPRGLQFSGARRCRVGARWERTLRRRQSWSTTTESPRRRTGSRRSRYGRARQSA